MSQSPLETVKRRYRDAYVVANVVVGFGEGIKVFGMIVAAALFFVGLLALKSVGGWAIGVGLLGALVGALIYILGVLIAAQGQIQYGRFRLPCGLISCILGRG